MLAFDTFHRGLAYDEFLSQHGTVDHKARWDRSREATTLTEEQKALLTTFVRTTNVLVLAGAWCGDCAMNCPIFERFAEAAPKLIVRYLDRDEHAEVQKELQINGGNRVPVIVFFSEDGFEIARYGERTLTSYRKMVKGVVPPRPDWDDSPAAIVADWLREFERVQWILRLSPRLRRLHQD